ncbi:STAS domain-containing protein [Nocardioides sp.]|uniref:STAS domain-containing protein n=1 Tax=Nocardioides sp. TaxID=35761 RepID=UPI002611D5D5|nr:STAS domain-containing protein [Nocardioides sp.]
MPFFEARSQADATDGVRLVVTGDLDLATAPRLTEVARAAVSSPGDIVTLDLSGVTFLDSTGLGALLDLRKKVVGAGGRVQVAAQSPAVARVLDLAGLTELFGVAAQDDA